MDGYLAALTLTLCATFAMAQDTTATPSAAASASNLFPFFYPGQYPPESTSNIPDNLATITAVQDSTTAALIGCPQSVKYDYECEWGLGYDYTVVNLGPDTTRLRASNAAPGVTFTYECMHKSRATMSCELYYSDGEMPDAAGTRTTVWTGGEIEPFQTATLTAYDAFLKDESSSRSMPSSPATVVETPAPTGGSNSSRSGNSSASGVAETGSGTVTGEAPESTGAARKMYAVDSAVLVVGAAAFSAWFL